MYTSKPEGRQPIQLQPDVKIEFDKIHAELREALHDMDLTQSAAVDHLIKAYRLNAHRQQV